MTKPSLEYILQRPNVRTQEQHIRIYFPEYYNYLLSKYALPIPFRDKLYLDIHELDSPKTCPVCGGPMLIRNFVYGYGQACSTKCSNNLPKKIEQFKQSFIQRHGGVGYASQKINNKIQHTNILRYGYPNATQNPEISKKIFETIIDRYGNIGNASEIIANKQRATMMERYGVPHNMMDERIKSAAHETILRNHGGVWPWDLEKSLAARHEKTKKRFPEVIGFDGNNYICACPHPDCNKCTDKKYITPLNIFRDRKKRHSETCTILMPVRACRIKNTYLEIFIHGILDQHNISYETSNRTILNGLELDIYIPDRKIAIECNGIYWHSSKYKDANYHLNKWLECKKAGVQLISIWEDWLVNKPEIVESLVLSKLGIYEHRIGARRCVLSEIDGKESVKFLNQNHIQGAGGSTIKLGLKYNGKLVALMTFGKRRPGQGRRGDDAWELARFCSLKGWQVVGGAKRLLTHFINAYKPNKIVSFSCNDISDGTLYRRLGFTENERPSTSYWYIDITTLERYHRFTFSKNQIIKRGLAPSSDKSTWTEREVMETTDLVRLYDSGQSKWELSINL